MRVRADQGGKLGRANQGFDRVVEPGIDALSLPPKNLSRRDHRSKPVSLFVPDLGWDDAALALSVIAHQSRTTDGGESPSPWHSIRAPARWGRREEPSVRSARRRAT
jgi:hypothetical protein